MRINVFAYLDNNIGDDLMFMLLSKRFPQHEFYFYSTNSVITQNLSKYTNFIVRHPSDRNSDLKYCDAILSIGGSIFNDLNTFRGKLSRLRKIFLLSLARLKGKKILTIGCNLGPYKDKLGLYLTLFELKLNSVVTVRDTASLNLIPPKLLKNCHLADDIVYNFDVPESDLSRDCLGISAYRSTHSNENNYDNYSALAFIINNYISQTGRKVKIFAFDTEFENDLSAAHHILNLVQDKNLVEIIPYLGDINIFIEQFNSCHLYLAIRFHAAVLSDALGIDFIPIAYSNKMEHLISDKFPNGTLYKLSQIKSNSISVINISNSLLNKSLLLKGRRAKGNSNIHFDKMSEVINEK